MVKFCRFSNPTKASEVDIFAVLFMRPFHLSAPVAVVERNKTPVCGREEQNASFGTGQSGSADVNFGGFLIFF